MASSECSDCGRALSVSEIKTNWAECMSRGSSVKAKVWREHAIHCMEFGRPSTEVSASCGGPFNRRHGKLLPPRKQDVVDDGSEWEDYDAHANDPDYTEYMLRPTPEEMYLGIEPDNWHGIECHDCPDRTFCDPDEYTDTPCPRRR